MGRVDTESRTPGGIVLSTGGLELLLLQAANNTTNDKKEKIFFIQGDGVSTKIIHQEEISQCGDTIYWTKDRNIFPAELCLKIFLAVFFYYIYYYEIHDYP